MNHFFSHSLIRCIFIGLILFTIILFSSAQVNLTPVISKINVYPTKIDKGGSTQLSVEVTDPENDSLTFSWTSSCNGYFSDAAVNNPLFTVADNAEYGECFFTVTVSDGAHQISGTVTINIGKTDTNIAPEIISSFQSTDMVENNQEIIFIVRAKDPEGSKLYFQWFCDAGVFRNEEIDEYHYSRITWTAPSCGIDPVNIRVDVKDDIGLIATHEFLPVGLIDSLPCSTPSKKYFKNIITDIKLNSSDKESEDYFGTSVSISRNYAVVGAPREDGGAGSKVTGAGAAYIYERDAGGSWKEKAILRASNLASYDRFGISVSIDQNRVIVGAYEEDGGKGSPVACAGAAYIFERNSSGVWQEKAILHAPDMQKNDRFGVSVGLSGNYAIVGAAEEDGGDGNPSEDSGCAYIYERNSSGVWSQKSILRASNRAKFDNFGISVGIDGNCAVVGAYQEDGGAGSPLSNAGEIYVFERDAQGNWQEKSALHGSDMQKDDQFGISVSISGNYVIAGANKEDGGTANKTTGAGAAYIFERNSSGVWQEKAILHAPDMEEYDRFGYSVSIKGIYALVGAHEEDGGAGDPACNAGAVYLFKRDASGSWNPVSTIHAGDREKDDHFGYSVSVGDQYGIAGALYEDCGNAALPDAGSSYILDFEKE